MSLAGDLARARAASGLSQDDLAHALGISRAMVSYWEAGRRAPNDRQLAALSQLLRVPPGVLLGHEEPAPVPDVARMLLRGADAEVPDTALPGLREFVEFLNTFAELAEMANYPVGGMHQSPFAGLATLESGEDARRKSEEVRSHLRLGLGPIGDIDTVCELLGITVFRTNLGRDLSQTISGAFLTHPQIGFSILINLEMTPGRRRFTVAHELAHALFHSSQSSYVVSTASKPPRERFADLFAGEFLMPSESIRRVTEEQGFGARIEDAAEVIHLQRFFGVSYVTALVRLRQTRLMSQATYEQLKRVRPLPLARSLGYTLGEEEYTPNPDKWRLERFPQRFLRLLRIAISNDILSVPSVAALTQLSISEVAELNRSAVETADPGPEELAELNEFEVTGVVGAS